MRRRRAPEGEPEGRPGARVSETRGAGSASADLATRAPDPGSRGPGSVVQAKLEGRTSVDPLESEADAVADALAGRGDGPRDVPRLRAAAGVPRDPRANGAEFTDAVRNARGGGIPVPELERTLFARHLASDLGDVRLHTGPHADTLAGAIGARAFTYGRDVFFANGEYSPGSAGGRRLLAHELAHTVQQRGGARGGDPRRTSGERVQRSEDDEEEIEADSGAIEGIDPALEAQLRELFPIGQGPGAEVISTSTGAQSTAGELTIRALRTWRRDRVSLDDAYRSAAEQRLDRVGGGPDVVPTRGGADPPLAPTLQWGVLLAAWDYANLRRRPDAAEAAGIAEYLREDESGHSGNLGDVRAMLRAGSPFMRAASASYGRHIVVENPSASGMTSAIYDAIDQLAEHLGNGEQGQLTVNFQGHGGRGEIEGVDGQAVSRTALLGMASYARERGVHLTFILDTCNAGSAALLAENHELFDVAVRAEDAPEETRAALRAAGRGLIPLLQIGLALNDIATDLRFQRLRNDGERAQAVAMLREAARLLDELAPNNENLPRIPGLTQLLLLAVAPRLTFRFIVDRPFSLRQMRSARESLAPLLDAINDTVSRQVDVLRAIQ